MPACLRAHLQVVGAMGPPGGARNPVDPRFISLFSVFEIQFASNENLRTIYQAILSRCGGGRGGGGGQGEGGSPS